MGTTITYNPSALHSGARAVVGGWSGSSVPTFFSTREDAAEFLNNTYDMDLECDEATGVVVEVEFPEAGDALVAAANPSILLG